jgi:hypothetical protein
MVGIELMINNNFSTKKNFLQKHDLRYNRVQKQ